MTTRLAAILLGIAIATAAPATDGYQVLHSFQGGTGIPGSGLVRAADGKLYGVTAAGGRHGQGVVFRLESDGAITTIHDFAGNEVLTPNAPLLAAPDGNLYGTSYSGGIGYGTVFRVTLSGAFTLIHAASRDCARTPRPYCRPG